MVPSEPRNDERESDLIAEFRRRDETATRVIAEWKRRAVAAEARVEQLQTELDERNNELFARERENELLRGGATDPVQIINEMSRQFIAERDSLRARVAQLQTENEQLRAALDRAAEQESTVVAEIDHYDALIDAAEAECERLRARVASLQARVLCYQREVAELNEMIEGLAAAPAATVPQRIEQFRSTLTTPHADGWNDALTLLVEHFTGAAAVLPEAPQTDPKG